MPMTPLNIDFAAGYPSKTCVHGVSLWGSPVRSDDNVFRVQPVSSLLLPVTPLNIDFAAGHPSKTCAQGVSLWGSPVRFDDNVCRGQPASSLLLLGVGVDDHAKVFALLLQPRMKKKVSVRKGFSI